VIFIIDIVVFIAFTVFDITDCHALTTLLDTTTFFLMLFHLFIGALEFSNPALDLDILLDDFPDVSVDGLKIINWG
jgi:hypothetical protein